MKKIVCAALGFALMTGTVLADAKKDAQKKATFEKMDTDEDGTVTLTEFTEFWKQRFKNLDQNGDRVLDNKEWSFAAAFKIADSDKDGKVDPAEHEAFRAGHFKVLDQNKDGHLTVAEYTRKLT